MLTFRNFLHEVFQNFKTTAFMNAKWSKLYALLFLIYITWWNNFATFFYCIYHDEQQQSFSWHQSMRLLEKEFKKGLKDKVWFETE